MVPALKVRVPRLLPVPPVLLEARPTVIVVAIKSTVPPVKSHVPLQLVVPLFDSPSPIADVATRFTPFAPRKNATGLAKRELKFIVTPVAFCRATEMLSAKIAFVWPSESVVGRPDPLLLPLNPTEICGD